MVNFATRATFYNINIKKRGRRIERNHDTIVTYPRQRLEVSEADEAFKPKKTNVFLADNNNAVSFMFRTLIFFFIFFSVYVPVNFTVDFNYRDLERMVMESG